MTRAKQVLRRALLGAVPVVVLTLLHTAAQPPPGEAGERAGTPRDPRDSRLQGIHDTIERTFLRCDARELRPALSRRVKIYVSTGLLGTGDGYFGADQLLLLLRRLFAGRSTVRFTALPAPPRQRAGQTILTARWLSRDVGGAEQEMRVSFTLAPEGPGWSIREIRELK